MMRTAPLYIQLADRIEGDIRRGSFGSNQKLPSIRDLMLQHARSLATVTTALEVLRDRGLITSKPREGSFVVSGLNTKPKTLRSKSPPPRSVSVQNTISLLNRTKTRNDVINLGAAVVSTDWVATAQITRAIKRVASFEPVKLAANIVPAPGLFELRNMVTQIMSRRGVLLDADEVVITNGDTSAMEAALRIVNPKRKAVAVEFPTYFGILQILERNGLQAVEIETHPNNGMNLEALNRALVATPIGAIIVNPTFHNPCGFTMPNASKKQLVDIGLKFGVPIIEDDVFGDLHFGPFRPAAVKSFDQTGNVLHCSSFSKIATPGWRLGWIVPGRWRDPFIDDQLITSTGVSSLPQYALAELLRGQSYNKHLQIMRNKAALQAPRIREEIIAHFPAGTCVSNPAGGFLFWVEVPGLDVATFTQSAQRQNVAIAPGTIFSSRSFFQSAFRLSFGMNLSPATRKAIRILGTLAQPH